MRTPLIAGVAAVALLVAGVAVAADTDLTVTPAASETDAAATGLSNAEAGGTSSDEEAHGPGHGPGEHGFGDRLDERQERRAERREERRDRIEAFARDVAAELGLEPEELSDAVATVASERLDAAVDAGIVDEATAQELRAALDSGDRDRIREAVHELLRASLAAHYQDGQ